MNNKIFFNPADQLNSLPAMDNRIFHVPDFLKQVSSYFNKNYSWLLPSGRSAIGNLLDTLELTAYDEVYITTTFEYPNISSCVTCTVFNYCKPSRVFTANTKAIFIIHEFGVPHPKTFELINLAKEKNIPVIEDCAHTIDSYFNSGERAGAVGDWTIVSFPKIFPVSMGGLLSGNKDLYISSTEDKEVLEQAKIVNGLWSTIPAITKKRIGIFNLYKELLSDRDYEFIDFNTKNFMPWFFPLKAKGPVKLINKLRQNNVECGLWHGSDVVVLPLHQYIDDTHVRQICAML